MTIIEIYNNAKLTASEMKQMSIWLFTDCSDDGCDFYDSTAYEKLYTHFADNGEMPYNVATGKHGEPDLWILERLEVVNERG